MSPPSTAAPTRWLVSPGRVLGSVLPWQVGAAATAGLLAGVLVASGAGLVVLGLLVAVPALVLMHRQPIACVTLWIVLTPLVVTTESMSIRMVFWLVHRLLPLAALVLVLVLRPLLYDRVRPLGRLATPEWLALSYVVATTVSIAASSTTPIASGVLFYDRVVAPICLYVLLRLLRPDRDEVRRWLVPAILAMVVVQLLVGLVAWITPAALPPAWLGQLGERTVGSLQSVSVYGVTLILGALLALHRAATGAPGVRRVLALALFVGVTVMLFVTFSRASWLAGLLALGGGMVLHRRMFGRVAIVLAVTLGVLLSSGLLAGQLEFAEQRISSEQAERSALSRLPVAVASLRMAEARPITGWGYENFNDYDRAFQTSVAGFYPEKDHSSHNVYLTLLAEQGLVGLVLFLGPAAWWLAATVVALRDRRLRGEQAQWVIALWLALSAHVVVNNFSNMKVEFGLGLWWLVLGLIGVAVTAATRPAALHHAAGGTP